MNTRLADDRMTSVPRPIYSLRQLFVMMAAAGVVFALARISWRLHESRPMPA